MLKRAASVVFGIVALVVGIALVVFGLFSAFATEAGPQLGYLGALLLAAPMIVVGWHIWGLVHGLEGETASVSLANEPICDQQGADPRRTVALADLEDWMLVDGQGRVEGGFSRLAMLQIYKRRQGYVPRRLVRTLEDCVDLRAAELG